jgi:hypothetical protein
MRLNVTIRPFRRKFSSPLNMVLVLVGWADGPWANMSNRQINTQSGLTIHGAMNTAISIKKSTTSTMVRVQSDQNTMKEHHHHHPDFVVCNVSSPPPSPPDEFVCPITGDIMKQPLMTRYGINFERHAILQWIADRNATCPITRRELNIKDLIPNNALKYRINTWCETHGVDLSNEEDALMPRDTDGAVLNPNVVLCTCPIRSLSSRKGSKKEKQSVRLVYVRLNQSSCTTRRRWHI